MDVRHVAAIVSWMRSVIKNLDGVPDDFLFTHAVEALVKRSAKAELELVDVPMKQLEAELGKANAKPAATPASLQ